jgi:GNAT superfamily N-acetyltransferase
MNDQTPDRFRPDRPERDRRFQGDGRTVSLSDLAALRPILEFWLRDRDTGDPLPDEVNKVLRNVEASIERPRPTEMYFLVAEDENRQVVGLMGFTKPDKDMRAFTSRVDANPVELINAYIDEEQRGSGAGTALADGLEHIAREAGFTEVLVNSGPRYQESGWPFWDKRYGEPVAIQRDLYGPGGDAPVWRGSLE